MLRKGSIVSAILIVMMCCVPHLALAALSKVMPMYTPAPIAVPTGATLPQVSAAMRRSLLALHWQPVLDRNGTAEAVYSESGWKATVSIRYDVRAISISYKDSENLDYDKKTGEIHKRYNELVQSLEKMISAQLHS